MAFDPSLPLQKGIRELLLDSETVLSLVPADNIMDVTRLPERFPSIVIGEGQTVFRRFDSTAFATIHVWAEEPGLATSKLITDAIAEAISIDAQIDGVRQFDDFICHDLSIDRTRYLRDPDGYSHAIVSAAAIMKAV